MNITINHVCTGKDINSAQEEGEEGEGAGERGRRRRRRES